MPLHAPSLAKKLQCLYQRHALVNTHERLAEHLGIASNNISTWINGNDLRAPELLPNRHIRKICDLYEIRPEWLELRSLDEFKAVLSAPARHDNGPWDQLLSRAVESEALQLVRRIASDHALILTRGLVPDEDDMAVEQFHVGEKLYISLHLTDFWAKQASYHHAYCAAFCTDPEKAICLCPSALAPNPGIQAPEFHIPEDAPDRGLRVTGPTGNQTVVAILTRRPLPRDVYAGLGLTTERSLLDRIATLVAQQPDESQVLKKTFEVV